MGSKEIIETLRTEFPNATVDIALEKTTDRYNGHLLWQNFEGMSFIERQRRVFDALRKAFGEEAQGVSLIFTYTPTEYEQIQAE